MSLKTLAVGMCWLAGCAGSAIKAEPPAVGSEVSLELHTASKSGPGWQSLTPGVSLPSGTDFAVRIAVDQPAFLYVGQRTAKTELALLYPTSALVRVEPSQPAQIPAAGQWFRLDENTGEEALYVLLSEKPQELDAAKQLLETRGEAACTKTRDPPPPNVKHRDRGGGVRGLMGNDGLTVLCFPFNHI
jgi:hypothetical protein